MKWVSELGILALAGTLAAGCAASSPPQPFTYLSLARPAGPIDAPPHGSVERSFSRGGWYFLNFNFRPAADVGEYLEQAQSDAGSEVLRAADVTLRVPVAIDILLFGYNHGTDTVRATGH